VAAAGLRAKASLRRYESSSAATKLARADAEAESARGRAEDFEDAADFERARADEASRVAAALKARATELQKSTTALRAERKDFDAKQAAASGAAAAAEEGMRAAEARAESARHQASELGEQLAAARVECEELLTQRAQTGRRGRGEDGLAERPPRASGAVRAADLALAASQRRSMQHALPEPTLGHGRGSLVPRGNAGHTSNRAPSPRPQAIGAPRHASPRPSRNGLSSTTRAVAKPLGAFEVND